MIHRTFDEKTLWRKYQVGTTGAYTFSFFEMYHDFLPFSKIVIAEQNFVKFYKLISKTSLDFCMFREYEIVFVIYVLSFCSGFSLGLKFRLLCGYSCSLF